MRVAFDTSVLVAALVAAHQHHARALPWLHAVAGGSLQGVVDAHTLGELWSVLTRLPLAMPIDGRSARASVLQVREQFEVVTLAPDVYLDAMDRCASKGLRSGAVFDAIHLAAAEARGVQALVTFNLGDFTRLATPASPTILAPPDPPAVVL
jgi:predicted nucleic acid-binding protein